jgi:hypothetical protein
MLHAIYRKAGIYYVRFKVLTATSMKVTAFWDIVPCSFVEVGRRFRGALTSETSVYFNKTTQHYFPYGRYLLLSIYSLILCKLDGPFTNVSQ